jgi:hypothetical protein
MADCPMTSMPFGPKQRKFCWAIGHWRMLNNAHHFGSDLLDANDRGRFLTDAALAALAPYGPLWFCYIYSIGQHLGTFGEKILLVQSHAQVDEFLAQTIE